MKKRKAEPDEFRKAIKLVVPPQGRMTTRSAHAYRDGRGIELYLWVNDPRRSFCCVARISRRRIEEYLRMLDAAERKGGPA